MNHVFEIKFINSPTERYTVTEVSFQRNGVSGEGFYTLAFFGRNVANLMAVVFDAPRTVAVFEPMNLASHYRGDVFEPGLREAIEVWEASR